MDAYDGSYKQYGSASAGFNAMFGGGRVTTPKLTENSSAFDRLYVYAIEQGLEDLPEEVEVCCTDEVCMDNAEAQIRQIANG